MQKLQNPTSIHKQRFITCQKIKKRLLKIVYMYYAYNIDTMTSYQPMEIRNKLLSHLVTEVGCKFTLLSRKFSCI